jgi:ATP-dependent DNA ligase
VQSRPPAAGNTACEAFNHLEWLFELKYDGFRALARIERNKSQLISRNGHPFALFSERADSERAHSLSALWSWTAKLCAWIETGVKK